MPIRPLNLSIIKKNIPNLYESVVVAAKRARKINDDTRQEFNQLLSTMNSGHEDEFEDRENPEQFKLSIEFEKREKPHIYAINELVNNQIEYRFKNEKDK
jgi:DNA-directed RNA polymerase subunit K/omega